MKTENGKPYIDVKTPITCNAKWNSIKKELYQKTKVKYFLFMERNKEDENQMMIKLRSKKNKVNIFESYFTLPNPNFQNKDLFTLIKLWAANLIFMNNNENSNQKNHSGDQSTADMTQIMEKLDEQS